MSKKKSEKKELTEKSSFDINKFIPEKYHTIAAIGVILLVFLIYFSPMYFGGKTLESGDIITSKSSTTYLEQHNEGYTLWNPYIFCGMPAHAISVGYKWFNLMYVVLRTSRDIFSSFFAVEYAMWSFYLILLAISSFLLVKHLTNNWLLSLLGGLATSFSTGLILFLFIGHVTKLTAIAFYPLIFLILLKIQGKNSLKYFALLTIILQFFIQGWHVQIIFYTLFSILIYFLYYIISNVIQKQKDEAIKYFKTGVIFTFSFIIALLIQSDNLTQIYQYNNYSTRGTQSIQEIENNQTESDSKDSDFYQYATNWSFSPGEILTFVVPSYYGFGNSKYSGPLTKGNEVEVNTYFGQMPFTDMAMYMGIIIFFFGLLSIYINWDNHFIRYLFLLIIFALLISFGRTFPIIYDLMFNYFPFFDKFRVPSMILILVQLSFPILAILGIQKILTNDDKKIENIIKYSAIIFSIIFILTLIGKGFFIDGFNSRVAEYISSIKSSRSQQAQQFQALSGYMSNMYSNDLTIAFALLSVSCWLIFLSKINKINSSIVIVIIIVLTVFDLTRINNRGAKYNNNIDSKNLFNKPNYISVIEKDNSNEPYRILNIKQDGSIGSLNRNSNFNSYFLQQDMYGYSSIKPRFYQDFMDILGPINLSMWNMLNVKYIISEKEINYPGFQKLNQTPKEIVYKNNNSLPRAYFVDSSTVLKGSALIKEIGKQDYNSKKLVFTDMEIQIDKPDSSAFVKILGYQDEKIEIKVNASGNNLLFLGDTYYPNGWKAFIDNKETEILKINHGFRGIIIPKGEHNVVFSYLPITFVYSKYIELVFSTLIILLLLFALFKERKTKLILREV